MTRCIKRLAAAACGLALCAPLASHATLVTFGLGADDYASLTINGTPICTFDAGGPAGGCNGSLNMTPGTWYSISIDYKNRFGSDGLSLAWDQPGPASIGYGSVANILAPNLVPLADLRYNTGTGYIAGLHGDYYNLSGGFVSSANGEGPIDAINNIYNNQVVGSWNGFGYFSQFEERLTGEIMLASAATPEPASLALIGLGMLGFGFARRRKA